MDLFNKAASMLGDATDLKDKLSGSIKILGGGCAKCNTLEENVNEALSKIGIELEVEHVTDDEEIASYGVMSTPALVFNDKVISTGKVLNPDQIKELLAKISF